MEELESPPAAARVTTKAAPASPASKNAASPYRVLALLILGAAGVVALLGVTGYYRQRPAIEQTRPLSAGSEASERGMPAKMAPKGGAVTATPQDVGAAGNPAHPKPACTDANAALGLCQTQPVPPKEAEISPKSTKSPSQITGAEAGTRDPPRRKCTEAVTALGLCATEPPLRNN